MVMEYLQCINNFVLIRGIPSFTVLFNEDGVQLWHEIFAFWISYLMNTFGILQQLRENIDLSYDVKTSCCLFVNLTSAWKIQWSFIYSPLEIWWHVRRYLNHYLTGIYFMWHHIWLHRDLQKYFAKEIR